VTIHGLFYFYDEVTHMHYPSFKSFEKLAGKGNLIPIYREILADMETPVSALAKLQSESTVFLLESAEGGEKWGRYTFLGTDPRTIFRVQGTEIVIRENGTVRRFRHEGKPLFHLRELLTRYRPVSVKGLPRFYGGAIGYLGYDMVRYFETLPADTDDDLGTDDAVFILADTMIVFDNIRNTIMVVACAYTGNGTTLRDIYDERTAKIDAIITMLNAPVEVESPPHTDTMPPTWLAAGQSPADFKTMVEKAKDYITAGDIIQVVISRRFETENHYHPVDLYRALRYINPSPYLFFLKLDNLVLIGSSPEVMVRLEEGVAELRPIAGTRRRGRTEQEDRELADELLQDPKEKAEHIMLVDLGRNDLGRVARIGSVQVTQLMTVERYSHVMHLVSNIRAQLAEGKDCFDVLAASFPAGTLTGAPKIRAMEIIDELEQYRRGPYGGAVGYISFSGNMDMGITIRTIMVRDGKLFIQTGAGIVADSDPEREYEETLNKAEGMMQAIRLVASRFTLGNT